MNRRHFFKSLATVAGAASVSPLIFIPKFEPVRWRRPALTQSLMIWKSQDLDGTRRLVASGDAPITDLITPGMGTASDTVECGYECRDGNYKIVTEEVKFTTPGGDMMFLRVDHSRDEFTIGRA